MSRESWLEEKRREIVRLRGISTNAIVPSRRDFSQFIASRRSELALVPRLKRRDACTGAAWDRDLLAMATALDETEIAALAVCTATEHGGSADDLTAVSQAVSAPVLRDDLCLDEVQVFDSRLRGADAVRLPVAELSAVHIERLIDIGVSLHMTPVLDVNSERDLERVPLRVPQCVGVNCVGADGFADLPRVCAVAGRVPTHIVVVLLAEVRTLAAARSLRGHVDGIVAGDALLGAADLAEEVERFLRQ
jgi:indole-3-glycerol phosphate synthase